MFRPKRRGLGITNYIKKSGDVLTGSLSMNRNLIKDLGDPVDVGDAVNRKYIDTNFVTKVSRGTTADGDIDMKNYKLIELSNPVNPSDAATRDYADSKLSKTGGTINGTLTVNGNVSVVGPPTSDDDIPNKSYMDSNFLKLTGGTVNGNLDMNGYSIFLENDPVNLNDGVNCSYLNRISDGNITIIRFRATVDGSLTTSLYGKTINGRWISTLGDTTIPGGLFVVTLLYEYTPGKKGILQPLPETLVPLQDQLYGGFVLEANKKLVQSLTFISGSNLFDKENKYICSYSNNVKKSSAEDN